MGAWGPGLYSSDTASDVRDAMKELVRVPIGVDEIVAQIMSDVPDGRAERGEEGYTDFWLALADQFHAYGLDAPEVMARAIAVINDGSDLALQAELDMEPADLNKRADVLEKLKAKWAAPDPKPRNRRIMKAPEPLLFAPGDCVAYRTMFRNAPNLHFPKADLAKMFRPDGWSGFVVFDAGHHLGYFAAYLVAALHLHGKHCPSVEDFWNSCLWGIKLTPAHRDPAVRVATLPAALAKKFEHKIVGNLPIDLDSVKHAFGAQVARFPKENSTLVGLLRAYCEPATAHSPEFRIWPEPSKLAEYPFKEYLKDQIA